MYATISTMSKRHHGFPAGARKADAPFSLRFTRATVKEIPALGFRLDGVIDIIPSQHVFVFRKTAVDYCLLDNETASPARGP